MKKKKILFCVVIAILLGTLIYSTVNIIVWLNDKKSTDEIVEDINNLVEIEEIKSDDSVNESENVDKENPYYDYMKMSLIDVDFSKLLKMNNEVKGWLQVSGTTVNYPFVQHSDNSYYLTKSINKKNNGAGWIFMDYRNSNFEDKNTIIYGHGRTDKTMFGSLKNVLKKSWQNNSNNHIIKISTEKENTLWQIFSIYHIPTTSDYIQVYFTDNDEFMDFGNMLISRSIYDFKTTLDENDKIVTLSTCYGNNEKLVVHAKLIKKEAKE